MVAPPPLTTVLPTELAAETTALATAAEHGGTSHQGGLTTTGNLGSVLEQLQAFPPLPPRSTHVPAYTSNETLARVQLGSTHFSPPDPQSQGEERMMDKHTDRQFNGNQAGQVGVSRQGDGQQRN
ncbi:unnamed protein product [Prunus armeniaca]